MRSAQLSTPKTSRTAKCSKADSLFAIRFAATPGQLPKPSAKTARHIHRSGHGPRDRQQQHALLESLNVVRQAAIEREQAANWQIKRSTRRWDLDVSADRLKRDSTFSLMRRHPCVSAQRHQHHAEVAVLE